MQAKIDDVKNELKKYTDDKATVDANLKTFDELDFVAFSNQEWTRLHEMTSRSTGLMGITSPASKSTLRI